MTFRAVIFDLDGTLLDTLADIGNAANQVLREAGFAEHSLDAMRSFIGEGVVTLLQKALPPEARTSEVVNACTSSFRQSYQQHWNVLTRPYDGIPELLDGLIAREIPLAVLSNKPHEFTCMCVDEYLSRWRFATVLGQQPTIQHKPDPTGALEIVKMLKLSPEQCMFVGDTPVDMQTAERSGMFPVGVLWGFRSRDDLENAGARHLLSSPQELLRFFPDLS